jgi:hypothetical protein
MEWITELSVVTTFQLRRAPPLAVTLARYGTRKHLANVKSIRPLKAKMLLGRHLDVAHPNTHRCLRNAHAPRDLLDRSTFSPQRPRTSSLRSFHH